MRNAKDFPVIHEERLRLGERLHFLFHGRAYKNRFAARAAEHGIFFSSRQTSHRSLFAATGFAMLVAMLAVVAWLGVELHVARVHNEGMAADLHLFRQGKVPAPPPAQTTQPHTASQPGPEVRIVRGPDEGAIIGRADLEQAQANLERAWARSRDLGEQLQSAREQLDSLRSEVTGSRNVQTHLADLLRESELHLSGMTAEMARLKDGRSEDTEIIASQKFRLRELTDRLNAESDTIDRERKLLVADLDIRELMGARNLHIVDVFDVDGKGKTQRPFGRVFYTEGKSLVFYAFDLKGGATFQAWGQREARDESAQSLGIFYVDDKKQNRWVLKFENPKVLAEINAVFVTVEPPGGSSKPNRQKMLYAYLNATANHP